MNELLDTTQAAAFLKTPPKTLVTWRSTKRVNLPYCKIGGNVRYRLSDLSEFVNAHMYGLPDSKRCE